MLFHSFPRDHPSLKRQTLLTNVDDATYHKGHTAPCPTTFDRIIQIICFAIFLGWLRFLFFLIFLIAIVLILIPLALLCEHETGRLIYYPFAAWCARKFFFPFGATCLGVDRIRRRGAPDPRARCFADNHVSMLDGPCVYAG
jgi:hypothetical protein